MSKNYLQFTGTELIADILMILPEGAEILASHGIACASCHINQYETLSDGILGHGYNKEVFNMILSDLNEAAQEAKITENSLQKKDPYLTKFAAEKILEFQKDGGKEGFGLKVEVTENNGELSYFLDFQESPEKGDRVFRSEGIRIFCDEESFRLLQNKKIDYLVTENGEGFKFEEI